LLFVPGGAIACVPGVKPGVNTLGW